MNITLNKAEYEYLIHAKYLDSKIINMLSNVNIENNFKYTLDFPSELIEEMRLIFEDRLQDVGFNEKYDLTDEGKIIENLIDKFFIG